MTTPSTKHREKPAVADHLPDSPPPEGITTRGTVAYVVDGDTLDVMVRRTVRLLLTRQQSAEQWLVGERVLLFVPSDERGRLASAFLSGHFAGRVYRASEHPDMEQCVPETAPPHGVCLSGIILGRPGRKLVLDVEVARVVRVRLLDCWAPESRTRDLIEKQRGLASKRHLQELCPRGRSVTLHVPAAEHGHFDEVITLGRVLGRVWLDAEEQDLSTIQCAAGHAYATKAEWRQVRATLPDK